MQAEELATDCLGDAKNVSEFTNVVIALVPALIKSNEQYQSQSASSEYGLRCHPDAKT
jgi:hypothetical protein